MKIATPQQLLSAYCQGYFPMPDPKTQELLWYKPNPRAIIPLDGFHVSRSLRKSLRNENFNVSINQNFPEIINSCSLRKETWINDAIKTMYNQLHELGFAHSVEIWHQQKIVGGVYGVAIAKAFFAESMFHTKTDASKAALYYLVDFLNQNQFELLECQFLTPHLASLGAIEISEQTYEAMLTKAIGTI